MIEYKKCDKCKQEKETAECLDKVGAYCHDCHNSLRVAKICNAYEHIKGCYFCGCLASNLLKLKSDKYKNNLICGRCDGTLQLSKANN